MLSKLRHSGPREPSGRSRRSTRYAAPKIGRLGEQADHFLRQPLEVLLVADGAAGIGLAVLLVQEDEVDVAGIVQLDAAQLAEAEHDEPAALAVAHAAAGRTARRRCRRAKSSAASTIASARYEICRVDGVDRLVAHDVAVGDPQRLAPLEPPQRRQHLGVVAQRAHFADELFDQRRAGDRLALGHPQQVVRFLVGDQQVAEVLAGRKNLQQVGQGVADRARTARPSPSGSATRR